MAVLEYRTRVSYDDIDESKSLSFRGAMSMMQEAAIIHSDQVGLSFRTTDQTHVVWMLMQWRIRLTGTASWNETVTVRTWPRTVERATSERDFEIVSEDGHQIAIGESLWVLVNADTGRITRISPQIAAVYDLTDRKLFLEPPEEIPAGVGTLAYTGKILKRDLDTNHHANNRAYLDYAREAISDVAAHRAYRELIIRYRDQMLLGRPIFCYSRDTQDCTVVDICSEDANRIHATIMYKE